MKKIGLLAVIIIAISVGSAFAISKVNNIKSHVMHYDTWSDQLSPRDPSTKSINQGYVNSNYLFF